MNRKLLSGLLALALSLGAVACNNNSNKPEKSDQGSDVVTTKESEDKESSPADDSKESETDQESNDESNVATVDTSEAVNLIYYLWGSEGVANKDLLAAINEKMSKDINATLEVRYIDWGEVATRYPLLFAAGEEFDMSHASPNASVSYFKLASDGGLADLTDHLSNVPALMEEIPEEVWATTKYKDRIYGVPTMYSEFTPTGYVYRMDKVKEYGVEKVTDIASFEAYADAAIAAGDMPINGASAEAMDLYHMFVDTTDDWIMAPGIGAEQPFLVGESVENFKEVSHPAFSDQFMAFAKKTKEWADKGYWQKDILASQVGDKDNFHNGLAVGYFTHMADWTGSFGVVKEQLDGVELDFWTFAEANNKILKKAGVENSTVISVNSKNIDRALMAIELFMTDESYYRLIQNGIEGRQYEIVDGMISTPEAFDEEKDAGGFAAWSLRNDRFNIPYVSEDPRRYELIEKWNETSKQNPFAGFSFDSNPINTQLSNITSVNDQLGIQIMLGKADGDVEAAVENYRSQLTSAGVEDVIKELKNQLESFTPIGE